MTLEEIAKIPNELEKIHYELIEIKSRLPHNEEPEKWMQLPELEEYLGIPRPTLYAWVAKKEIPFAKKGKRLYFSKREIDEWLREGRK